MNKEEHDQKMSQLIAKCWADEDFKRKLVAEPAATLKAEGWPAVPDGLSVRVLENTDKVFHLVIPSKRTGVLTDADLENVSGGVGGVLSASYWYQHPSGFGWGYDEPGGYGPKIKSKTKGS